MNQLINQYDRNFDPIADHFAKKVYGSLKGQIRLAVLNQDISELLTHLPNRPLKILDVGAGMGQISLNLAKNHQVTLNDISQNILSFYPYQIINSCHFRWKSAVIFWGCF